MEKDEGGEMKKIFCTICLFLFLVVYSYAYEVGNFYEFKCFADSEGNPYEESYIVYGGYYLGEDEEYIHIRCKYYSAGGRITEIGQEFWLIKKYMWTK